MMKKLLTDKLLYIAIGFIICLLITTKGCKKEDKNFYGDITKVVTKIDSTYTPKKEIKTTSVPKIKLVPYKVEVIKRDTIYTQSTIDSLLASRTYQDTIKHSNGYYYTYKAIVTGTLDSLDLGSIDTNPQLVVKETTTIVKHSKGIYAGVGLDETINPNVEVSYVDKRQSIDFSYKPIPSIYSPTKFNITYKRRISFK